MTALSSSAKRLFAILTSLFVTLTALVAISVATAPAASATDLPCQVSASSSNCGITATATGWNASGGTTGGTTGPGSPGGSTSGNGGYMYYTGYCLYGQLGNGTAGGNVGNGGLGNGGAGGVYVYPTAPGAVGAGASATCITPNGTLQTLTDPSKSTPVPPTTNVACAAKLVNGVWSMPITVYARTTDNKGWTPTPNSNPKSWQSTWEYACAYPNVPATGLVTSQPPYGNGVCIITGRYYMMESGSASIDNTGTSTSKGSGNQMAQSGLISEPFKAVYPGMVCTSSMKASWATQTLPKQANGVPLYGFYRLSANINYKSCALQVPYAWTNDKPWVKCGALQHQWQHQRYTYTCTRGFYQASGPNGGQVNQADAQYFDPKTCAFALNPNPYTCNIPQTTIAKQTTAVSVMRNGSNTPVAFGKLSVTGKVRNVNTQQRATFVVNGSSPAVPGASVNGGDNTGGLQTQFYALGTGPVLTPQNALQFSTSVPQAHWYSISNVGNNGYIFYYWASDPGKTWQMYSIYRFVGQLQIEAQNVIDGNPYLTWSPNLTLDCSNQSTSPKVTVLRSVNEQ